MNTLQQIDDTVFAFRDFFQRAGVMATTEYDARSVASAMNAPAQFRRTNALPFLGLREVKDSVQCGWPIDIAIRGLFGICCVSGLDTSVISLVFLLQLGMIIVIFTD